MNMTYVIFNHFLLAAAKVARDSDGYAPVVELINLECSIVFYVSVSLH